MPLTGTSPSVGSGEDFYWQRQSIWIGQFSSPQQLPAGDSHVGDFMQRLIDDLNQTASHRSSIYIKFYFSKNNKTRQPEIHYMLICNHAQLPESFTSTLVNVTFEKYQLTEQLISQDKDFKKMLDHYLNWNNFYIYYNLIHELQS